MSKSDWIWLAVGAGAQGLFALRMLAQWWVSEREGRSVVPRVYWHLSLVAGICMFAYACRRADPVFIVGQSMGVLVYSRNLMLGNGATEPKLQRALNEASLQPTLQKS